MLLPNHNFTFITGVGVDWERVLMCQTLFFFWTMCHMTGCCLSAVLLSTTVEQAPQLQVHLFSLYS